MPYYDYICKSCHKGSRLFFTYAEYGTKEPICRHCQSKDLQRRIGRVALGKSEDARMDSMMDESALAGLDEEDPREIGRFMRKMSRDMGEDMGEEFNEVVDRLEKGQSPEDIEAAMPDLASGGDDGFV
ncbi:MAG: zinc ribbon domain-containing protein [Ardenticatenaceae bacterium]|nr:zinc ribbon domain-containing protein [Ardenticatenaceae bacterium]